MPERSGQWDYVHANSVALDGAGDFIVSARHTSSVLRISRATGRILWRLGGARSDFRMGEGTRFAKQHDARPQADGTLTLFDNSAPPPQREASRAITLRLDSERRTATLVQALKHPDNLLSATQGGAQRLPGGGMFVGWGSRRYFTEYDAAGRVVLDGRFASGGDNYRAYKFPWSGRPARPAGARRRAAREPRRRARELERGDGGRELGTVGGPERDRAAPHQGRAVRRVRDRDLGGHGRALRAGPRAGRRRARCSVRARRSGPIRPRADTGAAQAGAGAADVFAASWPQAASMSRPRVRRTVAPQPVLLERGLEGVDRVARGPVVDRVRRVVRDQVELVDPRVQDLRQPDGVCVAVVDAGEHHVLDEDLAALAFVVRLAGREHLGQRVARR